MTLHWIGIDMMTGSLFVDLPNVEISQPLMASIGQAETTAVVVHVDDSTNPDWEQVTTPGYGALIAYDDTAPPGTVAWGGLVQQRYRDAMSPDVQLALVTPEAYLDACLMGDYNAVNVNQDLILQSYMAFASGSGQWQIALNNINPSTQTQTVNYTASAQTTVLSALQALSAVQGGPEWTIGWHWDLVANTITPTMTYGSRVGAVANPATGPAVTIENGDLMSGGLNEDYSSGMGANQVIAYGSAAPNATSSSVPMVVGLGPTDGRPIWAFAYQPNATVTDLPTLGNYAYAAVIQMTNGAQSATMQLPLGVPGKQLGIDWNMGDDIGFDFTGLSFPTPIAGVVRCVGYQLDQVSVTPILKVVGS